MIPQPTRRRRAGQRRVSRRSFLQQAATSTAATLLSPAWLALAGTARPARTRLVSAPTVNLPHGSTPSPVALPHFPDRLHAYVWRNWPLVPLDRLATVVGAKPREIRRLGLAMGLGSPPWIPADQQRRSYLTVIRRNWHLLPYAQLLELLGWTAEQMAFTLREDDFLFVKLGSLKPRCEPLRYEPPTAAASERQRQIARIVRQELTRGGRFGSGEGGEADNERHLLLPALSSAGSGGEGGRRTGEEAPPFLGSALHELVRLDRERPRVAGHGLVDGRLPSLPVRDRDAGAASSHDPLFGFIERLSRKPPMARGSGASRSVAGGLAPRFCYSYFALYGDPLLDRKADPYPEGYLARLADSGVDGVWLQAVLYKLAPFPWDPQLSARHQERLRHLRALVARARRHGIGVYLYLNEPRAMPLEFFAGRPQLQGVVEGDHAALCTSDAEVQRYLVDAVAAIGRAVPDLAGFFTITGSENLTNCWSHGGGARCPRCGRRAAAEVIAELNGLFYQGIRQAGARTRLIVWDWGWAEDWVEPIIARLPAETTLMSVSEWDLPIRRGGIATTVGEYSISAIGPGPRATRHWHWARQRGLRTIAKMQAGNTWELSAVPYIPALENVAQHAANLRAAGVDGLMLGWTLGGYPSPNLEVVAEIAADARLAPGAAMERVARQRFGPASAPAVVRAWRVFSAAFREFPFSGGLVYNAPMQFGPSNLFWAAPTGYHATMIGFPYDDLDSWRAVYPVEVFIGQFDKVADGFERGLAELQDSVRALDGELRADELDALAAELNVAETAAIHFRSTANQARFVAARRELARAETPEAARSPLHELERVLHHELDLARRLHAIQSRDSRIGFEASNQYYYVPVDLAEKILNCRDLLDHWLPTQRERWGLRSGPA